MKKVILGLAAAIILWCSMLATAYASNICDFSHILCNTAIHTNTRSIDRVAYTQQPAHDYVVLKCEFHAHSKYSDGQYSPTQLVDIYKNAGYDVLALTDHNTIAGFAEAQAEGQKVGLTVICGEEISVSWNHILAIFVQNTIPADLPASEVKGYFDEIHEQGAIGIVAHAWLYAWSTWQNYMNASYIDGWETGTAFQSASERTLMSWVYTSDYAYLFTHDFHSGTPIDLQNNWTCLLAYNNTEAGVREALESKRIVNREGNNYYGSPFALSLIDRSIPENGAVSIAFDDSLQSQYDYAWPLLQAKGMTTTLYVTSDYVRDLSGNSAYLSVAELQNLYDSGCEIASHSKTHPSFPSLSDSQIIQECTASKQVLQSYGFTVNNFAYPYGGTNDHIDSIVSQYYRSGRSAYDNPYIMQLPVSQFRLLATAGNAQTSFSELKNYVDNVIASRDWAIILFHDVVPEITGKWQTSTQVFSDFLDYLVSNSVTVLTVNQALTIGSRDVAITSVVPSTFQAIAGTIVNINVTVRNEGAIAETFNVNAYYNNTKIETQVIANLAPGATKTLTFNWNTDAVPVGNYTLKAEAGKLPDETDTADNVYVDGTVKIVKAPTASFTCYPSDPLTNEPVLFDASSSTPNSGTITNYRWNFDDGNITSTSNPTAIYVYTIPRTYNVTLTVTSSESLTASSWTRITVSAPVQTKISVFTHSSANLVGFKIEINGTLTDSGGNGISGANIIISYGLPDISEWIPLISAATDFQGNYHSQWIPPAMGDFILKAEWIGNQTYGGTNENTALSIISYEDKYVFSVASNSAVSTLMFNSTSQTLEFNATGPPSTTGSTQVTIARTLVADATKLKVYLDGKPLTYSASSMDDSWIVSFTYAHSTHHIRLDLNPPRLRGDIDNDGEVNMADLSIVAAAFKSRPKDERWNPAADLNSNGVVDIVDIAIAASEYGKHV